MKSAGFWAQWVLSVFSEVRSALGTGGRAERTRHLESRWPGFGCGLYEHEDYSVNLIKQGDSNGIATYRRKRTSKPVNVSRLRNQNAKDNQSETANEVFGSSQSKSFLSLFWRFLLINLSPSSWRQSTPNHFWFWCCPMWIHCRSNHLLDILMCLGLSSNNRSEHEPEAFWVSAAHQQSGDDLPSAGLSLSLMWVRMQHGVSTPPRAPCDPSAGDTLRPWQMATLIHGL